MPSTRRLTTLAGAVFVGVAATALFASPASAHNSTPAFEAKCDTATGKVKVTLTVDNDWPTEATLSKVIAPAGLSKIADAKTIPAKANGKNGIISETLLVEPGTIVKLSYHAAWDDKAAVNGSLEKKAEKDGCKPQPECPPSAEAKGAHPTPTCPPSPTPPTKPTPTPSKSSAAPALPVTGAQTGLYAGGAAVLLAAGGGLFLVARRRRLKFEA
jgi:LPXTG-motif cell wall-anchored protein